MSDLSDHLVINIVFIVLFILIGIVFSKLTMRPLAPLKRIALGLAMGLYFLAVFINFNDGHAGGWSPSNSILDKLAFIFISGLALAFFSKTYPVIAITIGLLYQVFFGLIQKFNKK